MSATVLTGGCQCGAVRYRVEGRVTQAGVCHCRMCQKAGGNFGMAFFGAPSVVFTRGAPADFESSPGVRRGFCRLCGTPLFMREDGRTYDMTVGSLDRPDDVPPMKSQVGIESECRWFRDLALTPRYPTSTAYDGREPGVPGAISTPITTPPTGRPTRVPPDEQRTPLHLRHDLA
jgi:hypothetical protein